MNGTPYGVDVDLRNSDRGGVVLLGRALPEQSTAKHEVYDGGDRWIFEFTRGGVVAGDVEMSRDALDQRRLARHRARLRRAAARRRGPTAVPGGRLALSDRPGADRRLLEPNVVEQSLPGIGMRYELEAIEGGTVCVVVHHSGRRDVDVLPRGGGDRARR